MFLFYIFTHFESRLCTNLTYTDSSSAVTIGSSRDIKDLTYTDSSSAVTIGSSREIKDLTYTDSASAVALGSSREIKNLTDELMFAVPRPDHLLHAVLAHFFPRHQLETIVVSHLTLLFQRTRHTTPDIVRI